MQMKVTPLTLELIMWFTAFFQDPPIPNTIIRAKLSIAWFTFGMFLMLLIVCNVWPLWVLDYQKAQKCKVFNFFEIYWKLEIGNSSNYGISCLMLDFKVFFMSFQN